MGRVQRREVAYFAPGATRADELADGSGADVEPTVTGRHHPHGHPREGPGRQRDHVRLTRELADRHRARGLLLARLAIPLPRRIHVPPGSGIGQVASPFGTTVSLISDTPGVTVPATVEVPAGNAGAFYTMTVDPSVPAGTARIRASWNGQTTTNTICIQGDPLGPQRDTDAHAGRHAGAPATPPSRRRTSTSTRPGSRRAAQQRLKLFTSQSGSRFECRLDGPNGAAGSYETCPLRPSYSGLADGDYTFHARSVDPSGNRDSTPDRITFKIAPAAPTSSAPTYPPPTPRIIAPEVGRGEVPHLHRLDVGLRVARRPAPRLRQRHVGGEHDAQRLWAMVP